MVSKKSKKGASGSGGSATPATRALDAAGVSYVEARYTHEGEDRDFAAEAVRELGLQAAEVFKTLVARTTSGDLVVAVLPSDHQLDLKALARAIGAKGAEMAAVPDAERATGYVRGGISPLGQRTWLRTVVDASAEALPRIYVSGGRRGFDIGLAPVDLLRVTGATSAPLIRE